MKIYDFFIRLCGLVSVYNNVNKNLPSSHFLFILLQTETKRLSQLKKSYIFIISFSNITRRQVPPVLKTIFIFQSWTPNLSTTYVAEWFLLVTDRTTETWVSGCFEVCHGEMGLSALLLHFEKSSNTYAKQFGKKLRTFLERPILWMIPNT